MPGTALIAGHGPGFCEEFAYRLAEAGYGVGLFARSEDYLAEFETELRDAGHDALAVPTDITDPEQMATGVDRIREELGPIEVVAHTASFHDDDPEGLDLDRFEKSWRVYTYAGLLCFRETLSDLRETDGTMLFFGAASDIGTFDYRSAKAATRGLARSLAEEYGPEGIQVTHVVVGGSILNPDKYERVGEVVEEEHIDPAELADTCLNLVEQDARSRTFELDVHAAARTFAR